MSLFDLFRSKKGESRRAKVARAKELAGDLAGAVELYLAAELPDEAARALLLRADAEPEPERRIVFCAQAARTAATDEVKKRALARKARLSLDLLRARGGTFMKSELAAVARELEQAGELEQAADAYALAGDVEAEVRALTAAGAIDRLEDRLRASQSAARDNRELDVTLRRAADLDRTAERRAALELLRSYLEANRGDRELELPIPGETGGPESQPGYPSRIVDERVGDLVRTIRARLARGPVVDLEIDGVVGRCALGAEVTIGRGDATLVVSSRAISRRHVRLRRDTRGEAVVEDLQTRNGTLLAGARLSGPMPVGPGIRIEIGGEIPCSITPCEQTPWGAVHPASSGSGAPAYLVEVAGERYVAPLASLRASTWHVEHHVVGDDTFVVLVTPQGSARPYLGGFELATRVELCVGDEIRASRGGPVVLRMLGRGATGE